MQGSVPIKCNFKPLKTMSLNYGN